MPLLDILVLILGFSIAFLWLLHFHMRSQRTPIIRNKYKRNNKSIFHDPFDDIGVNYHHNKNHTSSNCNSDSSDCGGSGE